MKKLINTAAAVVDEMIEGIVGASDHLAILDGVRVVVRSDYEALKASGKVALISGGGCGHEPAHAGYVGPGMLTAAVCGDVFTSPSTDAVLAAIRAVTGPAGALLIVKNYTGDRLNFGLAAEIARNEGLIVEMVVVGDDVAHAKTSETAGRRGLAGTVLVHKIAGAAAESGMPIAQVSAIAMQAISGMATMGVGLTPCTVPAAGKPNFTLADGEIEFGLGIHGEAGVSREAMSCAADIVERLCTRIFDALDLKPGERVALLVNNLGATPAMEMSIVGHEVLKQAAQRGLAIDAIWVGTFLTAIEMAGCSITALRLTSQMLANLQAPSAVAAWQGSGRLSAEITRIAIEEPKAIASRQSIDDPAPVRAALTAIVDAIVAAEGELTSLDQQVGDGDLGLNLARGASAIGAAVDEISVTHPADLLQNISMIVRKTVGGTSGALYAAGLLRAAAILHPMQNVEAPDWARALGGGAEAIATLGDARIGDRTMLDALLPAAAAFQQGLARSGDSLKALNEAIEAAREGAKNSAMTASRRGRSSYLGDRVIGVPDPGAEAVVIWLRAVRSSLG